MNVNPPFWLSFFGGAFAHSCEVLFTGHILDRVKVEQEIHTSYSVKNAIFSIWKKGKWKEFSKGLKWNVALSALKGGCGWSIHNISNRTVSALYPQKDQSRPSFSHSATVGICTAFLETSFIACPLERLKTFEMTQQDKHQPTVREHIKQEGIGFFYKGWNIVLLRQSLNWVTCLGIYQLLRQPLLDYNHNQPLSLKQKIVLGAATGSLVAIVNAPVDLLKTHAQRANILKSEKILETIKKNGIRGMYNGLKMKVLRQSCSSAITLFILDQLQALPQNMKV
jgi:Mitochondrial carrier protein